MKLQYCMLATSLLILTGCFDSGPNHEQLAKALNVKPEAVELFDCEDHPKLEENYLCTFKTKTYDVVQRMRFSKKGDGYRLHLFKKE